MSFFPNSILSFPSPWDQAAAVQLVRTDPLGQEAALDPEVNFFVLSLEAIGAEPRFSCGGHPDDFYIVFDAPYHIARRVSSAGYFTVSISGGKNIWAIRHTCPQMETGLPGWADEADKRRTLRWASLAWVKTIGLEKMWPGPYMTSKEIYHLP